jgi:ribosomal protein S12 methylthiotransferase accessory factor YcaO
MTDRTADIQAGFSAGWSAKPEKTVPIAKSILEIRQALNVSHSIYSASIFLDEQREEEKHEERRKERQREIMWSKRKQERKKELM